jgi:hypothetical protein
MPLKLSHLKKNEKTITVPMLGDAVTLTYRPAEFTPALESQLVEHEGALSVAYVQLLERILVSWDIEGEKGKPLPTTAKAMYEVPSVVLKGLVTAICEDLRPPGEATSG